MDEHEHRTEEEVTDEQAVEDLEVPEGQQEDVGGGALKQGFPIKWGGASES